MSLSNRYSICSLCGTMYVYKKTTKKWCITTKTVYELQCPHCNYSNTKDTLKANKVVDDQCVRPRRMFSQKLQ